MPLLSTLVRGNIEESPRILYPSNYGEDFYPLPWIGGHIHCTQVHILPSFHEFFIRIEIAGPPSLQAINPPRLELHTLFVLFL